MCIPTPLAHAKSAGIKKSHEQKFARRSPRVHPSTVAGIRINLAATAFVPASSDIPAWRGVLTLLRTTSVALRVPAGPLQAHKQQ